MSIKNALVAFAVTSNDAVFSHVRSLLSLPFQSSPPLTDVPTLINLSVYVPSLTPSLILTVNLTVPSKLVIDEVSEPFR